MQSPTNGYDIFLSYTRTDAAAAERMRARLAEIGLRAFLDRYTLPAGQPWQPQLETALAGCRALVVLLGPSGLGNWQHREIQLGLDRQAAVEKTAPFPVIPVLLPGMQKADIPLGRFLGLNTWIDLRQGFDEPEALQRLVAGMQGQTIDGVATDQLLAGLCPYRGLLPFREQDAGLYFGRTRFVDELVAKARQRTAANTIAVVGRSGSGKSSVVYAGLFPALRREMGLGEQAVWDILSLRPLAEPLHQLARVFAPSAHDADPIMARAALNAHAGRFRKGEVTVAELVRERLQADKGTTRLLLYVDQWEELYTQAQPREVKTEEDKRRAADARLFVDLLLDAAATAPCTLVLSVRSDFYSDIQGHDGLRAAVQDAQVSLGPMSEPELRAAIEGPAKALGVRVHADLTARLIRDIGLDVTAGRNGQYDIGKLPLLEYALEQAWAKRTGPELGLGQYAGLEQALEERANQLYEHLSAAQRAAAKRLFVSLVTPGEGREDTRARITLPADSTTLAVVEAFAGTEARLIVTGDAAGGRSAEVSHEALIRHWDKLRAWVDENRENLRTRADLVADREDWLRQNKNSTLMIEPGLRLETARRLRDQPGDVVIDDIKDYIDASLARDTRRRRWRNLSLAAAILVATGMTGMAWFAWDKWGEATLATEELGKSQQDEDWRSALITNTIEGYKIYLTRWPEGTYSESIRAVLRNHESVHETYRSDDVLKLAMRALPKEPGEIEAMGIGYEYDNDCSKHDSIRKIYEAQTVLFTYYYLVRMYLMAPPNEEPGRYFGYPEARFHVQWIDLDPKEDAPIEKYSFANLVSGISKLVPRRLLVSLANLPDGYKASLVFFLEKALEYESHFGKTWSKDLEARLDETLVKDIFFSYADFGFFRDPDGCYRQGASANIARIPIIGGSTYISLRGFEEYIYSFWYRRTKEGTAGIAKRYIQFARDELRLQPAELQEEVRVVELTNDLRQRNGLARLVVSPELTLAARAYARTMAEKQWFDHVGPDGSDFADRVRHAGYIGQPAGENIAKDHASARAVVRGWIDSPGHRANMLAADADEIGVGVAQIGRESWWVMLLGRR